jgi:hypothetical protein
MSDRIGPKDFHAADGVEDWRVLGEGACAFFRTGSFEAGARLVQAHVGRRSPPMPPSTLSTLPVVEPEDGLAR